MLEVFASSILMSYTGFYIINRITNNKIKLLTIKNNLLIILLAIATVLLHKVEYTGIESFIIFLLNIVVYKLIFKIQVEESTIAVAIMMVIMFISDMFSATLLKCIFTIKEIRSTGILTFIASILVCLIEVVIIRIKIIRKNLYTFYNFFIKTKSLTNIVFLLLLIIGFCIFTYNSGIFSTDWSIKYIANITLMIILTILAYIFITNRNSYNQLTDEYDSLFSYIQNFEDWIEKEQLNRHEYKNQLAVLYCLTKEKKVKEKINEILEDNINIGGEVINQLKLLPKGGIKGLLYYKVAIGQKKKINITADVSLENNSILNKLTEQEIRVICKLIGIYLDNAIEAAEETRKKNVLIEVYELSNKVCFVFSNTFKKKSNFDDRNKKGITTKGEGHGNGLYFASKLIEQNDYLESKQDVVDGYYIQQLIIKRKESK